MEDAPFDVDRTEVYARRAVADLPFTAGAFIGWLTERANEATYHGRRKSQVKFDVGDDGKIYVNVMKVTGP